MQREFPIQHSSAGRAPSSAVPALTAADSRGGGKGQGRRGTCGAAS